MAKFRIYFNKKEDYPCIWSVDEGTSESEIRVQGVVISDGLFVFTQHTDGLKPPAGLDPKNEPSAWVEVHGVLTVENGVALIGAQKESK